MHLDDAARATVLAIDHGAAGVYNIVDDEPAALPLAAGLAAALGAKPPRHVPAWLARLAGGEAAMRHDADPRVSNAKAKRELGWQLRYPSWRQGFADILGARDAAVA